MRIDPIFSPNITWLPEQLVRSGRNVYAVCNASTSGNALLRWKFTAASSKGEAISVMHMPLKVDPGNKGIISDSQLSVLCRSVPSNVTMFSVDYDTLFYSSAEHDGAIVSLQQVALIVCDTSMPQEGYYSCAPSDHEEEFQELQLSLIPEPESPKQLSDNTGAIAGVVVIAVLIIVVMVGILYWGVRRYRQLKYEAMQMRPMDIPLTATQLTHAINQAFSSYSPIGSPTYDQFTFARENLTLLEVIG